MNTQRRSNFNAESVSYGVIGATLNPDVLRYTPSGFWAFERSAKLGTGRARYESAREQLWQWQVHLNAGVKLLEVIPGSADGYRGLNQRDDGDVDPNEVMFTEHGHPYVNPGARIMQQYRVLGRNYALPERVVAVIDEERRAGYVLGTLEAHPLVGERSFVLEHRDNDEVWLLIRQIGQLSNPRLRVLAPLARLQSERLVGRYLKSLHPTVSAALTEPEV